MVKNYMQDQVIQALADKLSEHPDKYLNLCQCPACLAAIAAAALNHLKPFYVTGMVGEVYGAYHNKELHKYSEILVAVAKGINETLANDPNRHMAQLQSLVPQEKIPVP